MFELVTHQFMQIALFLGILPYYLGLHGTDRFRNLSKLALCKVELKLEYKYGNLSKKTKPKPENHHHHNNKETTTNPQKA